MERPGRGAIAGDETAQRKQSKLKYFYFEDFEGTLLYPAESSGTVPMKLWITQWRDSRKSILREVIKDTIFIGSSKTKKGRFLLKECADYGSKKAAKETEIAQRRIF